MVGSRVEQRGTRKACCLLWREAAIMSLESAKILLFACIFSLKYMGFSYKLLLFHFSFI